MNLGAPSGATVADGNGLLTIIDDDTAPSPLKVSVGDVTLTEGDTATHTASFPVRLTQPAAGAVTVDYTTTAQSATATADYTTKTGTVTIAAGAVNGSIKVPVVSDGIGEGTETFTVALSGPTGGAAVGRAVGTGTIVDDDATTLVVGIGSASVREGNGGTVSVQVPIGLSQPSSSPVTVVVNTANGTATAGTDYSALVNKIVTIPAGATGATVSVTIKSNAVTEADEILDLVLSGPSGAALGRTPGTIAILNDD